ncbi:hypothetical protein [Thalassolituus hydrocarboniclasticus]|uniref:Uncharacterized protein n=1 Tax=Thalassolituus hydrocarboniclasticus TaxID=2742796 RepID=A0ABY6A6M2_9GAMM|nr:hypothetical protein [Thalassolituus hydrocarboniclasticus]UXD86285.1 hypothetical protein HUF19_01945 [Thalassolituus hydrocarboniclasticus]
MTQTRNTTQESDQAAARQLLGTLSNQAQDIEAACQHQLRQTATQLLQQHQPAEQQALCHTLNQLLAARQSLLNEPVTTSPDEAAVEASVHTTGAENLPPQPIATRTDTSAGTGASLWPAMTAPRMMLLALLLLCITTASLTFSQQQHIHSLQQQLLSLQQSLQSGQQQLAQQLTVQQQERTEWRQTQQEYQHQITAAQQQLLAQQQQASAQQQEWQQRLAGVDKALALEQREGDALQQRINRLSRVSEELIANLCADSAAVGPAVGLTIYAQYMQRCQQSWELAAQ